MSFDLYFLERESGETWQDAMDRLEEAAANPSPLDDADLASRDAVRDQVRPLLPHAEEFTGESYRELSDDASVATPPRQPRMEHQPPAAVLHRCSVATQVTGTSRHPTTVAGGAQAGEPHQPTGPLAEDQIEQSQRPAGDQPAVNHRLLAAGHRPVPTCGTPHPNPARMFATDRWPLRSSKSRMLTTT